MRRALLDEELPPFGRGLDTRLDALAARAELDPSSLRRCPGDEVAQAVDADTLRARELGFETAPAFGAEGAPLTGAQSAEGLLRAVRDGLASAR